MKRYILILTLIVCSFQFVRADWSKAINKVSGKLVLIEFYEQMQSPQAIVEKERYKRRLTGVLVDENGLILTSSSIFKASLEFSSSRPIFGLSEKPADIRVRFGDDQWHSAEFVGKDDDKEIAFIRVSDKIDTKPLKFISSHKLKLGSDILILQHLTDQYDYDLVARNRRINAILTKPQKRFLCEDDLQSLSEFGVVITESGDAVGIIKSAQFAPHGLPIGMGNDDSDNLAEIISADTFQELIKNPPVYKEKETSRKKWLGIYMQPFTREMAKYYKEPELKGILINTIIDESPADKAGLQVGDIIVAVGSQKMEAEKDNDLEIFRNLIRDQKESEVDFTINRKGEFKEVKVQLGDTPISQYLADEVSNSLLGMSVKELTQDIILAKQLDWETEGVWVSRVERAGWADVSGLQIGDLILKINSQKISGLDDIKQIFDSIETEKPEYLSLFIQRGTDTQFLFIKTNFQEDN